MPPQKGHKHSPETIQRMREAHAGKKQSPEQVQNRAAKIRGTKRTEDQKRRMSAGRSGFSKRAIMFVEAGKRFDSMSEAAEFFGVTLATISKALRVYGTFRGQTIVEIKEAASS